MESHLPSPGRCTPNLKVSLDRMNAFREKRNVGTPVVDVGSRHEEFDMMDLVVVCSNKFYTLRARGGLWRPKFRDPYWGARHNCLRGPLRLRLFQNSSLQRNQISEFLDLRYPTRSSFPGTPVSGYQYTSCQGSPVLTEGPSSPLRLLLLSLWRVCMSVGMCLNDVRVKRPSKTLPVFYSPY